MRKLTQEILREYWFGGDASTFLHSSVNEMKLPKINIKIGFDNLFTKQQSFGVIPDH